MAKKATADAKPAKKAADKPAKTADKPTKSADKPAKKSADKPAKAASAPKTGGIHAPVQPSKELGAVVGDNQLPRSEVVSKVWEYIRSNNLQNPENRREILADEKLKKVFGRDKCTMFEMNKYLSQHLKAA